MFPENNPAEEIMIKPGALKRGDKVAIVSLSSGMGGDPLFLHRYENGKKRLESIFGLNVVTMPNTLKDRSFLMNIQKNGQVI